MVSGVVNLIDPKLGSTFHTYTPMGTSSYSTESCSAQCDLSCPTFVRICCAEIFREYVPQKNKTIRKYVKYFFICAKIVKGERRKKVYLFFPSRILFYAKIEKGERRKKVYLFFPSRILFYVKIVKGERRKKFTCFFVKSLEGSGPFDLFLVSFM